MGRLVLLSAAIHLALLLVVPRIPGLDREYDLGLDAYTVELIELPAASPTVAAPATEEVAKAVDEPPREEPSEEIPEEPPRRPRRVVLKESSRAPRKSLAERLAERLKEQEGKRPATHEAAQPGGAVEPASSRATVTAARFPYAWYLSIVQGKVSSNWDQPSARLIAADHLTVVVSFRIRRNGSIEALSIRRSSGRSTVDQSATKAVRSAAPFPPLPDDYLDDHLDVTIDFTITRR